MYWSDWSAGSNLLRHRNCTEVAILVIHNNGNNMVLSLSRKTRYEACLLEDNWRGYQVPLLEDLLKLALSNPQTHEKI